MRTAVTAALVGLAGAVTGLIVVSWLDVGAKSCLDVRDGGTVVAACAVPTAASWALWLGALAGAGLAVGALRAARRRRGA